jgi:hypothetical protein
MPRAASGCLGMATDRDRLTTFFYLLTRGTDRRDGLSWGHVTRVIDDSLSMEAAIANDVAEGRCLVGDPVFASVGAEALAREMARRLLGPVQRGATDSLRCAALRDAAEMLGELRLASPQTVARHACISEMIDRCNLAAMGVAYDGGPAPTPRDVLAGLGWRCVETEVIAGKPHELWSKPGSDDSVRLTACVSSAGAETDSDVLLSPTELRAFAAHAESL